MWSEVGRFKFNAKEVEIKAVTGEVLSTEQRSDTHVSGGGSTYSIGSAVHGSTSIGSTVIVTRNMRLKTQDGRQHDLQLEADFPLWPGDRLSVFVVNDKYYLVHNHTTGREFAFPFIAWAKPINRWILFGSIASVIVLVVGFGTQNALLILLGLPGSWFIGDKIGVKARKRSREQTRMFGSRFREAAKHILES